jgi:hypothetical protein
VATQGDINVYFESANNPSSMGCCTPEVLTKDDTSLRTISCCCPVRAIGAKIPGYYFSSAPKRPLPDFDANHWVGELNMHITRY